MIGYSFRTLLLAAIMATSFNLGLREWPAGIHTVRDDLPLPRDARDAAMFAEWCARIDKQVDQCAKQTRRALSDHARSKRAIEAENDRLHQQMRRLLDREKRIEGRIQAPIH